MNPPAGRHLGRALAQSRLFHFLVAGGVIFLLAPKPAARNDVAIDGVALLALERAQAQRLGAPVLRDEEARDVRTRAIEDEILYREALRLGLDQNDNIVRQRLIQKVLFLAEDLAGVATPATEADLRAFFERTREQWARPARLRLIHVYAGPEHRERLAGLREQAIAAEAAAPGLPPAVGEAFPLPRTVAATRDQIASDYGAPFADAVLALAPGAWSDPIRSKHGWHLVKVLEREEAGPATFDDVRGKLPLTYLIARKKQAVADFLRRAAPRYRITIDGVEVEELPASGRVAPERVDRVD